MKKGFIFGTAAVVLGLGAAYLFSKNKKKDPQQENEKRSDDTNVETLSPIVKKDYIPVMIKTIKSVKQKIIMLLHLQKWKIFFINYDFQDSL